MDNSPKKTRIVRPNDDDDFGGLRPAPDDATELDTSHAQGQDETIKDTHDIEITGRRDYENGNDDTMTGGRGDGNKTVLVGGFSQSSDNEKEDTPKIDVEDPPAGCLLVVAGPGKGSFRPIGYGHNSVGRGIENRIILDFGDKTISTTKALSVLYERRAKQFFVSPGDGANIAYLGDDAIMAVTQISGNEYITIGETTLRFFPFCDEEWSWETMDS